MLLFRASLQNAAHFVGVAYPPNKISKIALKMQAFYSYFMKFCLDLNSNHIIYNHIIIEETHPGRKRESHY